MALLGAGGVSLLQAAMTVSAAIAAKAFRIRIVSNPFAWRLNAHASL
ncbi:MAG TPA: hypothetical protein VFB13_17370 [Reyranella sp.]|nr:hypothetical protein [Reyranella sp.]